MSNVKIVKTKSGMFKMEATNSVATFEQFRKSPDQYTKGTSANGTADVKSQAGDKDYKQFIIESKALDFNGFVKMQRLLENEIQEGGLMAWLEANNLVEEYTEAVNDRDYNKMQEVVRPYYLEQQGSQQYAQMTGPRAQGGNESDEEYANRINTEDEEVPMGGKDGIPYSVLDNAPDAAVAAKVEEGSQEENEEGDKDDASQEKKEDEEDKSQEDKDKD